MPIDPSKDVSKVIEKIHSYLLFLLRDELELTPYKVRTTAFFEDDNGHKQTVETETVVNKDFIEQAYREMVKRMAINEANEIIKTGHQNGDL